jgi:phage/plasmid-associated DNA primase
MKDVHRVVKQLTGGDIISCRQLYSEQTMLKIQATVFMCCNDIPPPSKVDGGFIRRFRGIHMDQKFVANPNPAFPHEKAIDPDLDAKMLNWGPAFIWILVQFRRRYPNELIEECPEVMQYTKDIFDESDDVSSFAAKYIKIPENEDADFASYEEIETRYNHFCAMERKKPLPRHAFRSRLIDRYRKRPYDPE